ncbi:hypothetical protein Tco_1462732, partial [Tanacetum coccineum]
MLVTSSGIMLLSFVDTLCSFVVISTVSFSSFSITTGLFVLEFSSSEYSTFVVIGVAVVVIVVVIVVAAVVESLVELAKVR